MFFVTVPRALCTSIQPTIQARPLTADVLCNSEQVFWREANAYKRLLGPCFNVLGRVVLRQAEGCDETGRRTGWCGAVTPHPSNACDERDRLAHFP